MKNRGEIKKVFVIVLILVIIADFLLFQPYISGTGVLLLILLLDAVVAVLFVWILMKILKKK